MTSKNARSCALPRSRFDEGSSSSLKFRPPKNSMS